MKLLIKNFFSLILIIATFAVLYIAKEGTKIYYEGPVSDHFDGKNFHNYNHQVTISLKDILLWQLYDTRGDVIKLWPKFVNDTLQSSEIEKKFNSKDDFKVTFINHSTFLIQVAGLNILTDPVFSKRVSPVNWYGPARYRNPGVKFSDLPNIDYALVSHDHFDHTDLPTLKRLQSKFNCNIVSGLGIKRFLADFDIKSQELDWWQKITIAGGVEIYFVPALHWSGRIGIIGNNRTLWGGFVIKYGQKTVYFAGDTAFEEDCHIFDDLYKRFGGFNLSILPIGAYEPRWLMKKNHINPDEAVKIHLGTKTKRSIAAHFGCFGISQEGEGKPEADLQAALIKNGLSSEKFLVLKHGEELVVSE